jgi:hypothetical protein
MGTSIKTRMTAGIIAVLSVLNFLFIPVSAAEGDMTWTDISNAIRSASQATTITLTNDINIDANAAQIEVGAGKNITLDLAGYTIKRAGELGPRATAQSFFRVSGTSTVRPPKVTRGSFTLKDSQGGGKITGSKGASAISVGAYGDFTMESGIITGNTAENGAGVYVAANGVFTMNNGEISENTCSNLGGGVFMADGNTTFNLNGGKIVKNVAANDNNQSTDRGAGIYFGHRGCQLNLGAKNVITVTGNYDIAYVQGEKVFRDDNLYIGKESNHFVNITEKLVEGSKIGLRISLYWNTIDYDIKATSGYKAAYGSADFSPVFSIDQEDRIMILEDDCEIHFVYHAHTLVYEAHDNVLTVTCTGKITVGRNKYIDCNCEAVLKLVADDKEYDGNAYAASFDGANEYYKLTKTDALKKDIKYFVRGSETALEAAPVKIGEYTAKYSVTVGEETYTIFKDFCIFCGHHKVETIPGKAATCTEAGLTDGKKCADCGKILEEQKEIPALGHDEQIVPGKAATCTEKGLTEGKVCKRCGAVLVAQEEIPALDHDWGEWEKYDENQHKRVCARNSEHVEYADHAWDNGVVTKAATCEEPGEMTYTCTVCGEVKTVAIPATGHKNVTAYEANEPTCTEPGNSAYWYCADCDTYFGDAACTKPIDENSWVIPALGHDEQIVPGKEPTCTETGLTEGKVCARCGAVLVAQEEIPALGHDWGKVEYTWAEDNSTVTAKRICNNNPAHIEEETVKTTSEITTPASVDANGVLTYTSDKFENPAFEVQTKKVEIAKLTPTPTSPADDPSIKLKIDSMSIVIPCGQTHTVKASLIGSKAKITWKSSDTKIATVDENGKITAKKAGSVTVTATAVGKKAICHVQVLFKDLTNPNDFWYTPAYTMVDKGVVKGYENQTLFKPANTCTRAQMITFLWRLSGSPAPKGTKCKFKDVKSTDYFFKACIWGAENHIVEGYEDKTFRPHIVCARRHAVTFLWRLAGKPAPKANGKTFSDLNDTDYYYNATLWASEMKILEGYNDGTFRPDGDCLRRQMVTFLYKFDKFIGKKG